MALQSIHNVEVKGICSAVPAKNRVLHDEYAEMGEKFVQRIFQATGVLKRHIAPKAMCASDLACVAVEKLMEKLNWDINSINVVVLVTQTPDYILPNTSSVMHRRLGLESHTVVFDVNLGCSGYIYGLWVVSNLISNGGLKRALIVVADTPTKLLDTSDYALRLLFGDAASATAIEYNENASKISFNLKCDGSGFDSLIVPHGLFRDLKLNNDMSTDKLKKFSDCQLKKLYMQGSEIMNFALNEVPRVIQELVEHNGVDVGNIDYWVMHQASKIILSHIDKKLEIPEGRMLYSLDEFGNTSSVSIPMTISHKLRDILPKKRACFLLCGFGVGLSWGAAILHCGYMALPDIIYVNDYV
jgi:3-oxoacyl-[acyl-carrier-protein] synthase-3